MRVLHLGKYYPPVAGGVEYFLADLLGALERRGITTAALVHKAGGDPAADVPSDNEQPIVHRVPTLGRFLYVPISPTYLHWLNRRIREFRPDLLHLHVPNVSAFTALLSRRARALPWVVHWHADVAMSRVDRRLALAYRFYRPLEQQLLAKSAAVIATSPPYLQSSDALRRWRERCLTIPLGLDANRLRVSAAHEAPDAEPIWGRVGLRVLSVGRLTYYKGHDVLIDATGALPDARTIIVGTGDQASRLRALIQERGLQDRVLLWGEAKRVELAALLASCDVFCLPSIERTEAFGLVLLEAMHFAKPVVVSDIPGSGTGWLVRQAGNGLLTQPGKASAVADALRQLEQDPAQRRLLGDKGRTALSVAFSINAIAKRVADVYARVLGDDAR
ncbi:glycosyltransferase [uncultured Thiohalocapsa sp.]|uniref:glycosyltransferase n=1 Tax=uncultured Thiohalocapsa sp. TaxID=768990 RepID=UPI0025EFB4C1|nr:glycosyltransferase [uncultured Thiohalocapsa sp.]